MQNTAKTSFETEGNYNLTLYKAETLKHSAHNCERLPFLPIVIFRLRALGFFGS